MSFKRSRAYWLLPVTVLMAYLFLYMPIIILIILSFNASPYFSSWQGFSLRWYYQLFESVEVWAALQNSVIIALSATLLSLTLGMLLVFYARKSLLKRLSFLFYGALAVPEIVLAIGLLSVLIYFSMTLGLLSVIAGHTLIGLGYVVPMIASRMNEMDNALTEASMDLGATYTQTVYSVIFPFLRPTVIGAGLLVFIISFDDFIISFFCAGATAQTLPLYIFSVLRSGATPMINALSTLLLCISSFFVLLFSLFTLRKVGWQ